MLKIFLRIPFFAMVLVLPVDLAAETLVCERGKVGNGQLDESAGFYMSFYEKFRSDLLFSETRPLSSDELGCLVVPGALEESEQQPLLIDIRDQGKFEKYRIAKSINIPWHQLKRKDFLKEKHIVLVDEGYRYIELLENCAELKKSGFKHVSVLERGLDSGLPVERFSTDKAYKSKWISSREFYTLKFKAYWVVVDISGSNNSEGVTSSLYRLDMSGEVSKLRSGLQVIFQASPGKRQPRQNFLIVGESEEEYRKIEDIVSEEYGPYVYYLEGGLPAYNNFIAERRRIIAQKMRMRDNDSTACGN